MPSLVIIDYGYGNVHSIVKACEAVMPHGGQVLLTADVDAINQASHILLPGVGSFADCMQGINALPEVKHALYHAVDNDNKPFLGICVGMQLMASLGLEHGTTKGLGWFDATVEKIPQTEGLVIPHMGWNNLIIEQAYADHPIFKGLAQEEHVYFVHSYYMHCKDNAYVAASVDYGRRLPAVVIDRNRIGMQFHPEKSQQVGLTMLKNFLCIPSV